MTYFHTRTSLEERLKMEESSGMLNLADTAVGSKQLTFTLKKVSTFTPQCRTVPKNIHCCTTKCLRPLQIQVCPIKYLVIGLIELIGSKELLI